MRNLMHDPDQRKLAGLHINISFAFSILFRAYFMTPLISYLAANLARYTIYSYFLHYSESFPSFFLVIYLTLCFFDIFLNYFVFPLAFFFQFPYTFSHGATVQALRGIFL